MAVKAMEMQVTGIPEEIKQIAVSPVIVDILHLYEAFHTGFIPKGLASELVLLSIAKEMALTNERCSRILEMFFVPPSKEGESNVQEESAPRAK